MKIDQKTIDTVLEAYSPEWHYLREAELDNAITAAQGTFSIPKTGNAGYIIDTEHVNAINFFLCYNQLGYSVIAEAGRLGRIPKIGTLPIDTFKKLQGRNILISRMNNIRFRAPVDPKQEFTGEILIHSFNQRKNTYFINTSYSFEQGKATGDINLAIVLPE